MRGSSYWNLKWWNVPNKIQILWCSFNEVFVLRGGTEGLLYSTEPCTFLPHGAVSLSTCTGRIIASKSFTNVLLKKDVRIKVLFSSVV